MPNLLESKEIDSVCSYFVRRNVRDFNPCPAKPGYTLPLQTV